MSHIPDSPLIGASVEFIRDALNIPLSTAKRWKKNPEKIPKHAYNQLLFSLYGNLELVAGKEWENFKIINGQLFSPYFKYGFAPSAINALFFQLQELSHLRAKVHILENEIAEFKKNAEKYKSMIQGNCNTLHKFKF